MKISLSSLFAATALFSIAPTSAHADDVPKRVLFFSKSAGFQHDMIKEENGNPSQAERILAEIGPMNHLQFTFSKDGSMFTPKGIAKFDAFCFYTTGDLTTVGTDGKPAMPPGGKEAFLDAIRNGKGFVGIHCATDTFHGKGGQVDPFIKMIGGEFVTHDGWVPGHLIVIDRNFPGISGVPDDFGPEEEWYSLKNLSPNMHVILAHNTTAMGKKDPYNRPNFPETWAQSYGKGRVFYTSMGHRIEVWKDPTFQQVLLGGLKWATGQVDADVTPNIDKVTPGANELPK